MSLKEYLMQQPIPCALLAPISSEISNVLFRQESLDTYTMKGGKILPYVILSTL